MNKKRANQKINILTILVIFLISISIISSEEIESNKKSITGNIIFSENPNDLQKIYSKSIPSIVKINVYYTYDLFVPKAKSIEFKSSFDPKYPSYKDLNVRIDDEKNGFEDFFGESFWDEFYPGEYYSIDEFGATYKYELSSKEIIDAEEEFYDYHNGELPTYSGTGFIISPEGYILTNAHLVTLIDSEIEDLKEFLKISNYVDYYYVLFYNSAYNEEIEQEKYEEYYKKTLYLEENINITNLKISKIEVISGEGSNIKKYQAKLIDFNENYLDETGGRDWALLKIEEEKLPSLTLGNSDNAPIGEDIVIIGYPWTSEGFTEENEFYVAPTPTYGKISNIVPSGNYKDIQIDISIEQGNSGGPAINLKGEVIGIATSGYEGLSGTYNYLTPINDVKKELSITPQQSNIDTLWNNGLEYFWNEDYLKAKTSFQEIESISTNHPYVKGILNQLSDLPNTNKTTEKKENKNISGIFIIIIIIGVIIILLLLFIAINIIKKKKANKNQVKKQTKLKKK